jgi:hypothetical protein
MVAGREHDIGFCMAAELVGGVRIADVRQMDMLFRWVSQMNMSSLVLMIYDSYRNGYRSDLQFSIPRQQDMFLKWIAPKWTSPQMDMLLVTSDNFIARYHNGYQ